MEGKTSFPEACTLARALPGHPKPASIPTFGAQPSVALPGQLGLCALMWIDFFSLFFFFVMTPFFLIVRAMYTSWGKLTIILMFTFICISFNSLSYDYMVYICIVGITIVLLNIILLFLMHFNTRNSNMFHKYILISLKALG